MCDFLYDTLKVNAVWWYKGTELNIFKLKPIQQCALFLSSIWIWKIWQRDRGQKKANEFKQCMRHKAGVLYFTFFLIPFRRLWYRQHHQQSLSENEKGNNYFLHSKSPRLNRYLSCSAWNIYQYQFSIVGQFSCPCCLGSVAFLQSLLTADLAVCFPPRKTLHMRGI